MARLQLGADDLLAVNPRLVYASLHGFGEKGPYAGRPAYDDLIQGWSECHPRNPGGAVSPRA